MCSIVGSFSREKIIELCRLNEYRGQHSHSISYFNIETSEIRVNKELGPVFYENIKIPENHYCIVHMQAPTGEINGIHPAADNFAFLWHNGIVKQSCIPRLQKLADTFTTWDTQLILQAYLKNINNLSEIDGTFSCLLYNAGDLYLFRNEISPMFFDEHMNISSTRFPKSIPTDANKVFLMDLHNRSLFHIQDFKTVSNPYYFES